ncbi:hypothetical protein C5167_008457 [Papaver somniferum]|uniref:Exopolygalacturonase-like n=1 Tax=Papaver somniferum TaxID=3469 RepID=A0A4Y7JYG9_PAPSO|nr:exopolygalacturonase-like [Papaver somniferum]RZC64759.1 hypothetical protein C5167_008457 [Papaver somniferum]
MANVRINAAVILLFLPLVFSNVADALGFGSNPGGPPPTVFNVLKYGAVPNGHDDCAEAFVQAWQAACHHPGGNARLLVPAGHYKLLPVVFQGPCTTSPIVVQVQGIVTGSDQVSDYEENQWILFENINGLVLTGGGTFDGSGDKTWKYNDCHVNPDCQLLAVGLKFSHVTKGVVRQLNSLNPQGFHMSLYKCDDFKIHSMHITAPMTSPNTDGIHVSTSNNIRISRSTIATGDDCVSVGQGSTNVSVSKVTCGPGHGISVGSLGKQQDELDVRGLIVRNCTLSGTENGLRIKTWPASPAIKASHFIYQDIIMNNVKNPIIIDQCYGSKKKCVSQPSRVAVSDVHFINVHGTSVSNVAINIGCSPMVPCQNVDLFNVNLKYTGPANHGSESSSVCTNAKVGFRGINYPALCKAVA